MKNIKILSLTLISLLSMLCASVASAQQATVAEGYEIVDSVVYRPVATVDSTLVGKDVFTVLPDGAKVHQSRQVEGSMRAHVASNKSRTISGYRVRIFFDNRQTSRNESEAALKKFNELYPEVKAYRIYANPYFKVTVGDCRTKSEAMALLELIKGAVPSAFVVKENIEYPVVDKRNAVIVDTIKVMRPKRK